MARFYAYGHEHFAEDVGVLSGTLAAQGNIASGATRDDVITFPKAFKSAPVVVVGFVSTSSAGTFGRCVCAVSAVSTSSFTIRTFNGDSSNRNPGYSWIAVGQLA